MKGKATAILAVFWLLAYVFYKSINVLSYTPFDLTGWSFHGTFVWGWDFFWIFVYILSTSLVLMLLAYWFGIAPGGYRRPLWIEIVISLVLARWVFALVTWDTALLWRWLYKHEVARTWLPISFRNPIGISLTETMLFGVFLFIYMEIASFTNKREAFISGYQTIAMTVLISFSLWLYRLANESYASIKEGLVAVFQTILFFALLSGTLLLIRRIINARLSRS